MKMTYFEHIDEKIEKRKVPIIYLVSNIMKLLSRYEKGTCKDTNVEKLGELYAFLKTSMEKKKILCPLGNQLKEVGMSEGRKEGRSFLFGFTNAELLSPEMVENEEMHLGYNAFKNNTPYFEFDDNFIFEEDINQEQEIKICVAPIIKKDKLGKLSKIKSDTTCLLNEMKNNGKIEKDFKSQLNVELSADYQLLTNAFYGNINSGEKFAEFLEMMTKVNSIAGGWEAKTDEEKLKALDDYIRFLLSDFHHCLPYKWIESNLWAHRMQRQGNIYKGDVLDTVWAAAYLPFVDYAVTDKAFCKLLNSSGLAEQYKTKVYSMETLSQLIEELKNI